MTGFSLKDLLNSKIPDGLIDHLEPGTTSSSNQTQQSQDQIAKNTTTTQKNCSERISLKTKFTEEFGSFTAKVSQEEK